MPTLRQITDTQDLDASPQGSVVALVTDGKTVNVGFKTGPNEWGLAGKADPFPSEQLFRLAVGRDGFALAIIHEPES